MVGVWLCILIVQLQCVCGRGPLQDEKHWRRPVPGWRQTPESLSLEIADSDSRRQILRSILAKKVRTMGIYLVDSKSIQRSFEPRKEIYRSF